MIRNSFKPLDWLNKSGQQVTVTAQSNYNTSTQLEEVERIIQEIEVNRIDVTSAYSDWVNIGFAFADEFGETGRNLFHRVSQFHPDFSTQECDEQFDKCLKSKGKGISLKSFFHYAKQAGIPLAAPKKEQQDYSSASKADDQSKNHNTKEENKKETDLMPTLPDTIFPQLPDFLKSVINMTTSKEERDILLLGSIVAISACLPKVSGIYDGKRVYPNLFLFITAQASAGKGVLVHCRQLVGLIHKELREEAKSLWKQYQKDLKFYNTHKNKIEDLQAPIKPPEKMLFIPANNSSTGAYQLLGDNDGRGLIFETEGDTLSHAFKSDYGNYSDGFRKAFHHETISYYRRTDREYVDIEKPRLSTLLSGTPKQIASLIPSAENGLFSRFIFYSMPVMPRWKNVFSSKTKNGLDDHFEGLGKDFFHLHNSLKKGHEIQFMLTSDQQDQFNEFFEYIQNQYLDIKGLEYMATVRRLGLIAFRTSMILSVLRIMETGETSSNMVCEDRDFETSLLMVKVLVKHSSKVFSELPEDTQKPTIRLNKKEIFLSQLPKHFNRQKYLEVAKSLKIADKTAEGYISRFVKSGLIHHEAHDNYTNTTIEDSEDSKEVEDS